MRPKSQIPTRSFTMNIPVNLHTQLKLASATNATPVAHIMIQATETYLEALRQQDNSAAATLQPKPQTKKPNPKKKK